MIGVMGVVSLIPIGDRGERQEPATEQFDSYRADGDGKAYERARGHYNRSHNSDCTPTAFKRQHHWGRRVIAGFRRRELRRGCSGRLQHELYRVRSGGRRAINL